MTDKFALCIPREVFTSITTDEDGMEWDDFVSSLSLQNRKTCETDENFLQFIPYVAVYYTGDDGVDRFFVYSRGKAGDENRLHGKVSMGLGGHVDTLPKHAGHRGVALHFTKEALRELNEEIGLQSTPEIIIQLYSWFYDDLIEPDYIYDDSDEVGKHHIGVPAFVEIDKSEIGEIEKGVIENYQWLTLQEIEQLCESGDVELEKWSNYICDIIRESKD